MNLSEPNQMNCLSFLQNKPTVGSRMEMEVNLPQEIAGSATVKVLCQGKVVEVEKGKANGRTGVVCTIENYRFITAAAEEELAE